MSGGLELLFAYKAPRTFLMSLDVILEAIVVRREKASDLPYIPGVRDIDGRHHVEKGLNGIRARKLDQSHLVPDFELVRRHGSLSPKKLTEQ
jgi:hypothetical protein